MPDLGRLADELCHGRGGGTDGVCGCLSIEWLDAQAMFDSSMSAATIAAKVNELQKAAGFSTPLLNPEGRGTSFITLTGKAVLSVQVFTLHAHTVSCCLTP